MNLNKIINNIINNNYNDIEINTGKTRFWRKNWGCFHC